MPLADKACLVLEDKVCLVMADKPCLDMGLSRQDMLLSWLTRLVVSRETTHVTCPASADKIKSRNGKIAADHFGIAAWTHRAHRGHRAGEISGVV